ncbi:hypothetical protein B0H14DRAFT_2639413 [Mycena olivaceomarginata]|nr:hypothetical protein B0H14DRAFT_2639413 [Mycena olivaceomarginata]
MSSADFALNNQDPEDVASGRSLRNCQPTATFGQYLPAAGLVAGPLGSYNQGEYYPELFDDAPQLLDDDPAPNQPPRKPQFLAVAITVFISGTCIARAIVCSLYWPWPDPYPPAILPCVQIPRVNHRKSTHETIQGHRCTHPLAGVMETFDFALNQSLFVCVMVVNAFLSPPLSSFVLFLYRLAH